MTLKDLGYTTELDNYRKNKDLDSSEVGRIISEHKERYVVKTSEKEYEGEIIGNLRFSAVNRHDFPAVGDWVAISNYGNNKVIIHSVFPRKNIIERQAVGKQGEKQIIATNIDYAFIVQAVDRDFNLNRIERYLAICNTSDVIPIIILNKIDLISEIELSELISRVQNRVKQVKIVAISNSSKKGFDSLSKLILKGKTYCLLGSSGVGKSTLLNNLYGTEIMATNKISSSTNKGRHITSHRELIVLKKGGIIIDNPGMREIGITDSSGGLEKTFYTIIELSNSCKYRDCTHTTEKNCAVLEALRNGKIDKSSYKNYLKMEQEREHFESTVAEKRKKDKDFGKMIKNYKKDINKKRDK